MSREAMEAVSVPDDMMHHPQRMRALRNLHRFQNVKQPIILRVHRLAFVQFVKFASFLLTLLLSLRPSFLPTSFSFPSSSKWFRDILIVVVMHMQPNQTKSESEYTNSNIIIEHLRLFYFIRSSQLRM